MSTWENGYIPTHVEWSTEEYISTLELRAKLWEARARKLRDELVNINESVNKRGFWLCPSPAGEFIKLVPAESTSAPSESP